MPPILRDERHQSECLPFKNWKDFLDWKAFYDIVSWKKLVVDLAPRSNVRLDESLNRIITKKKSLFCHDMKGGYLEDRFLNGARDIKDEPYCFSHWSLIDTFVYFSHDFITIPPLGWINSAHAHGVSVLGTLIIEGNNRDLLDTVLDCYELFVQLCSEIQKELGFEGWLLNIEIGRLSSDQVTRLLILTEKLTSLCPIVIWYDSVTINGVLDWRNKVDDMNYAFFKAAHGIYLNYCWNREYLKETLEYLEKKGDENRISDVYVGIDVFGRGCPGGGGFGTDIALKLIKPFDFSVAIFAPGWTYENQTPEEKFFDREYRFWDKLRPYLGVRGLSLNSGVLSNGFYTNFQPGFGREIRSKSEFELWWLNLRKQDFQPNFLFKGRSHVIDTGFIICDTKPGTVPIFFCELTPSSSGKTEISIAFEALDNRGISISKPKISFNGMNAEFLERNRLSSVINHDESEKKFILISLNCEEDVTFLRVKSLSLKSV